jgi:hypothetical protein
MKIVFSIVCIVFLLPASLIGADNPKNTFCGVVDNWLKNIDQSGKLICSSAKWHEGFCSSAKNQGQGICMTAKSHEGFCSSVKNAGQGICMASSIHSGFCSSVKNTSMGICQALGKNKGGGFCSSAKSGDLDKWIEKIKHYCKIPS